MVSKRSLLSARQELALRQENHVVDSLSEPLLELCSDDNEFGLARLAIRYSYRLGTIGRMKDVEPKEAVLMNFGGDQYEEDIQIRELLERSTHIAEAAITAFIHGGETRG